MSISAVILTKNEEKNIQRCLKSVDFCDEVIIVDDFSEDNTLEKIRNKYKTKVFKRKLNEDFAGQRNFGMDKAKGEWILFVDADEEVSDELKKEIVSLFHGSIGRKIDAHYLKRRDFWWGRELKYGEVKKLRNRGIIRLMRRGSGKWIGKVHEEFETDSKIGRLNSFINHYPHPSVKDFLQEVNFYSTLRAKELLNQREPASIGKIILFPFSKFILTYFIKLGVLDGPAGFAYAFFMSFHSFLVRAKLYQYNLKHET